MSAPRRPLPSVAARSLYGSFIYYTGGDDIGLYVVATGGNGEVSGSRSPRIMQLGMKFIF